MRRNHNGYNSGYNNGRNNGNNGNNNGNHNTSYYGRNNGDNNGYNNRQNNRPPQKPSEFRGLYGSGRKTCHVGGDLDWDDSDIVPGNGDYFPNGEKFHDSEKWIAALNEYNFPNGVPRFDSKAECKEFMVKWCTENGGSNPGTDRHGMFKLMHIFTMCVTWTQLEEWVFPALAAIRKEPREPPPATDFREHPNVYETPEASKVVDEIRERLDVPFHRCTNPASTMNTFKYLYHHMKCGIFVMIKNGELRIFAPFVNGFEYRNTWNGALKVNTPDGTLATYYKEKQKFYRREMYENDMSMWWANGNIICNEITQRGRDTQYWGDHFLAPLRDLLGEACRTRHMPDCEFFINKRDYPQLKVNVPRGVPVEPYGFIFDKDDRLPEEDVDLAPEHCFKTYAPIVSFYAARPDRFTDLPWPSSEDWEAACGLVFPQTFRHRKNRETGAAEFDGDPRDLFTEANFRKFERAWEDKIDVAFFRGTATGGGTTVDNNQRLKVTSLSYEWKDCPEKGGNEETGQVPFLNAEIVGWNLRDKKLAQGAMTYLRQKDFPFTAGRHHFTPIYEQSLYKYLVYVDGHCAACRYGFMMRLGSVILKVAPRQVADTMWYFPLLKPYYDHVPVLSDLSDLEEKIRWCREHDHECREIADNAKALWDKWLSKEPSVDYIEMVCKQISQRYVDPPFWWDPPPPERAPPRLRCPDGACFVDRITRKSRLCVRCQEDKEKEGLRAAEDEVRQKEEKQRRMQGRGSARERMRKKAAEAKRSKMNS